MVWFYLSLLDLASDADTLEHHTVKRDLLFGKGGDALLQRGCAAVGLADNALAIDNPSADCFLAARTGMPECLATGLNTLAWWGRLDSDGIYCVSLGGGMNDLHDRCCQQVPPCLSLVNTGQSTKDSWIH